MNKQEQEQIIIFLKARREANRKDIGKHIGEGQYGDKLKSHLNYLTSGGNIKKQSEEVYSITPKGDRFVSFANDVENEELEIRLAKSNIEANELQKTVAESNRQIEIKNRRLAVIAVATSIVTAILIALQVILMMIPQE